MIFTHANAATATGKPKIKVLCVDDSALIRDLMTKIIDAQPDLTVVATAPDPLVARDLIKRYNPDVLTLDVEMPRMDGLDFLERLMRLRPMPVLMVSSLTQRGSEITLRALELGAVDFVAKPEVGIRDGMLDYANTIADKIRAAAQSRPKRQGGPSVENRVPEERLKAPILSSEKIVIIGASTGGTEAIRQVLEPLPANSPAILITQHMPSGFTHSFAERLDRLCRVRVKEAEHNERVLPGHVYIAPGDWHMRLQRSGANYVIALDASAPVNRHRPSVDVLFSSAASCAGRNALGVILTGMGKDGAAGLAEMRRAGAHTVAQDEGSCVVFGMPKEAIALGGAECVVPLTEIAGHLVQQMQLSGRAQRV
ncbi:protein-glutamate methylesterase/protein-glutamine glutaminase [Salinicola halophilus]|uniref:protein-glutamate methylesterase/protein-glutamine glutaminase n=1 Tax=Salinicola halophilus TaxID=184065 RepID=UPI0023B8363E|nr:chemotaxis response regulator protein-glutamate methylesterase [Salinicola halophilus]